MMTRRVRSGLVLLGVGIVLIALVRLATHIAGEQQSIRVTGMLSLLMVISVVIAIFGIIRLVAALITKT